MLGIRVHDKDALDELKAQSEVGLRLLLTYRHERNWVLCDEVLEADGYLCEVLEGEAAIDIVSVASNDEHHLWEELPKFGWHANVATTCVVNEDVDAVESILDGIKTIWSQRVHQDWVDDRQNLTETSLVFVECFKDSPDGSDATCCGESALLLCI